MTTFVWRDGHLVEKHLAACPARSALPAPMIILDTIDAFFSHADGKLYDSKQHYYRTLKDKGLRIVEGGENGASKPTWKKPVIEDVTEAYKKVRDGYKPPPLQPESAPLDE